MASSLTATVISLVRCSVSLMRAHQHDCDFARAAQTLMAVSEIGLIRGETCQKE